MQVRPSSENSGLGQSIMVSTTWVVLEVSSSSVTCSVMIYVPVGARRCTCRVLCMIVVPFGELLGEPWAGAAASSRPGV